MKNDFLSDALRRGDPAEGQSEARPAEARQAELLARCAAEPFTQPARLPLTAQTTRPRKTRWAIPALAGALTAAALYAALAWFGASNHAVQTVPDRIVKASPRPSTTPAPRTIPTQSVAAQTQKRARHRRDTSAATAAATGPGIHRAVAIRPLHQADAPSPAPAKTLVRSIRKGNAGRPNLIATVPKAQAAPSLFRSSEPVVERVIIEQDATPTEPTPTVTTVAITLNGRSESVIVSRAAEPTAN